MSSPELKTFCTVPAFLSQSHQFNEAISIQTFRIVREDIHIPLRSKCRVSGVDKEEIALQIGS